MGDENPTPVGVVLPEDLSNASPRDIAALKVKVAKAFEKIKNKDVRTADDLAELAALKEQMTTLRAEEATRAEQQAEINSAVEELSGFMEGTDAAESSEEGSDEGEGGTGTPAAPEASDGSEGAEEAAPEGTDAVADMGAAIAAAITAALGGAAPTALPKTPARVPIRTAARAAAPQHAVKDKGSNVIIASAASAGGTSVTLDRDGLSLAMHERARVLADGKGTMSSSTLVASISVASPKNDIRNVRGDEETRIAWDKAHRVAEEGLVASGGWCAPSETVYDFVCDFEAMPEMVDLPTMTANRGGVRYPISPLLGDVLDDINSGFTWTEDDDIAAAQPGGPTKPCFKIPCPEFDEVRLQAQGICLTAGNLTDKAYPELTNRYMDLVMTAHAHRMNGLTIAKMVSESTAVSPTVTDLSATEAILAGIELQIVCARDEYFMGADTTLEVVLPRWVRTVIRRDLARRAGVTFDQVNDSTIATFFSEIGARVQFVSDWQSLRAAATDGTCVTLPPTVDALVYPAGAHTKLDGGSIDLGVIRDSTLNATNDFTAAWSEEFWAVLTRCFSIVVTIPLCADGSTGVAKTIACPTA